MVERTLGMAADAMVGRVEGASRRRLWAGAALDSRQVREGELFFALRGEQTDGHRFVPQAMDRGASAAVVREAFMPPTKDSRLIRVEDPYTALHDLTRAVRRTVPRRLVAITGSAGKTTTKELLATILARKYRVARNPGNLNNLYGFPIALLGIPDDTEWMVAEMGMSSSGELGQVSRLGRPDAVILLNVRPVHLEFFDTLEAIAEAKAEILEGLAPEGLIVGNADDPEVRRVLGRSGRPVVWFGRGEEADVRAIDVEPLRNGIGWRFDLVTAELRQPVVLPLYGSFSVENCVAAAACALQLGVEPGEIATAVRTMQPATMRGEVHRLAGGATLVDDAYNSNPEALQLALESASELPGERHWAVLGDMLELGERGPEFHREAGRQAAELGFSPVIGVGPLAHGLVEAAGAAGAEIDWFETAEAAMAALPERVGSGDVILVKGSRGIQLDRVVDALRAQGEQG
jgi:UDP-N-acetylmuramoyl-tripeptide--D-alanyl-D-alanine ligase